MPAILDCGSKSLAQIAAASDDLIQRTQSGTLQPDEYTGGTFSISNMGMFEVTSFAAIIQPPQSAVFPLDDGLLHPILPGVAHSRRVCFSHPVQRSQLTLQ